MLKHYDYQFRGIIDRSSIQASNRGMIGAVIDSGIINGYEDGSFKPKVTLTRAEAAALLSRITSIIWRFTGNYTAEDENGLYLILTWYYA